MSDLKGITPMSLMRANSKLSKPATFPFSCPDHVKILALNGSGSPRYNAEALAAGCDDSIEKPFDIEKLRTYVVHASTLPARARMD